VASPERVHALCPRARGDPGPGAGERVRDAATVF
jgi:hypothetical protein